MMRGRGADRARRGFDRARTTLMQPLSLEYTDYFLGRDLRIPAEQHTQIDVPIQLTQAAARFYMPHLQLQLTAGYMLIELWPSQRVRAMFGCAATACHRLATTPASLNVHASTTRCWRTCMLVRVMRGYVSKVQVQPPMLLSMCDDAPESFSCLLY